MPVDDELSIQTNSELDQHFLSNPVKLALLIEAAAIQPNDHVVEVGAGIGTVAEHVPVCQSLTVIEYDVNLIPHLRKRVPHAHVIQGDALRILPTVRCDVLLSNLPSMLIPAVVGLLPRLDFRAAVITAPSIDGLAPLEDVFELEAVTMLESHDFRPPQSASAEVVRVKRRELRGDTAETDSNFSKRSFPTVDAGTHTRHSLLGGLQLCKYRTL
ncbi:MAG TPA: rRNA adenine N-6-methyltransferase family protein [Pseudonocardiaceae bacterium]